MEQIKQKKKSNKNNNKCCSSVIAKVATWEIIPFLLSLALIYTLTHTPYTHIHKHIHTLICTTIHNPVERINTKDSKGLLRYL